VKGGVRRPDLAPALRPVEERRAILWAGEQRGWWRWLGIYQDHYLLLIAGEAVFLRPDEVDRMPLDSVYSATEEGWKTAGIQIPRGTNGF
jgi:hypothetical protein